MNCARFLGVVFGQVVRVIHEAVSWFAFLLVHRVLFTITGSMNTYRYVLLNVKLICASAGVFR